MKKIFSILSALSLAALLTGCLGDNYEQPNAAIFGSAFDKETGELILQDIGGEGSQIEMIELAYEKSDTRRLNFKTDGTYRDNNFFKGDYKIQFVRTNFVPLPAQTITLDGDTQFDIQSLPWCRINVKELMFEEEKQRVFARFEVECTTDDPLKEVGLFCDFSKHVSYSINGFGDNSTKAVAVNKKLTGPTEFVLKMPLTMVTDADNDKDFWVRVGAHTSVVDARWNYAPAVKIHIVKKEIPQREYGIRWDLFDSQYMGMWEAGKHRTCELIYFDEKDFKSGDGSVVTKSAAAAAGETYVYTQFISPGEGKGGIKPVFDISAIPAEGCHMVLTLYVSDATHFERDAYGQIEVGSSGIFDEEECCWIFGQFELRNGWQNLDLSMPEGNYIGELRRKRMNWFRFYHQHEKVGNTTVKFDQIRFYYKTIVDNCDSETGWKGAAAVTLDEANPKEGEGCISTTNGASGFVLQKVYDRDIYVPTPKDGGHFQFWLYVSNASAVNGTESQVEITSSGKSDEKELHWALPTLSDGWNLVDLKLSDAIAVGAEPMDLKHMNFFRIYNKMSVPAGSVTMKVDCLRFYKEGVDTSLMDVVNE